MKGKVALPTPTEREKSQMYVLARIDGHSVVDVLQIVCRGLIQINRSVFRSQHSE
jgi:hypothetical protein